MDKENITVKIIQPKVEYLPQHDCKSHVCRCARVCYGKTTGNDEATYNRLLNDKHWSMFRHASVYAIINKDKFTGTPDILKYYRACPYISMIEDADKVYISTNENFMLDVERTNTVVWYIIDANRISTEEAENNEIFFNHLMRYTFICDTQISTSRELNRVSPNNISERSTRYCLEERTICEPWWFADCEDKNLITEYLESCEKAFKTYETFITKYGLKRQDARGVLPLDIRTKVVYTYTIDEWRRIIDLRYYGTTGAPHPNAKIIAGIIRNELIKLGYNFK